MAQLKDTVVNGTLSVNNGGGGESEINIYQEIQALKKEIELLKTKSERQDELVNCTSISYQTYNVDISKYHSILLVSAVRGDYRILTTTTIPVSYLQAHRDTACIAIYATEHQFYQAYMKLTTDNKLQVHCTSEYDRAIVYGLH